MQTITDMTCMKLILTALSVLSLGGCFDVELEVPVITQVATIEGNEILHKANAKLHGEILEPAQVGKNFGFSEKISQVRLAEFEVRVTSDSVESATDVDDLAFVESMVIFARSQDPDSGLDEIAVAWYYADETDGDDPEILRFEVDNELDITPYLNDGFELFSKSVSHIPGDDVSVEGYAVFTAVPEL